MKRSSVSTERVRKHRALKRAEAEARKNIPEDYTAVSVLNSVAINYQNVPEINSSTGYSGTINSTNIASTAVEINHEENNIECSLPSPDISSNDGIVEERENPAHVPPQFPEPDLKTKLRTWAVKYVHVLTNEATTDLLTLLRSEGHTDLPKSAVTLLKTKSIGTLQPMLSHRGSPGEFVYFGIGTGLINSINLGIYTEESVSLLFNFDGLPIFKSSSLELWPILCMVHHKNYNCKPFIVGLYCGDSKPGDVDAYLEDFVAELDDLLLNGINIQGKHFRVSVKAFVCDMPARAFIKCVKGHGGFYACERCEVKGETVNRRRVYSDADSPLRTNQSFRTKHQKEHHTGTSPLEKIVQLNLILLFVLDYLHLLCLGVMKTLFLKLTLGNNHSRLNVKTLKRISKRLQALRSHVPSEFQRKPRGLQDLKRWKAAEFRFVLLYAGPVIFKGLLPSKKYKHFLLLHVAARILCHPELARTKIESATLFLKRFFLLLPYLYGNDAQVMNFHNLLHLCDDVKNMDGPLDEFSAFPFENYLGKIKKLIRTPNKPLAQICRRLSELQAQSAQLLKKYPSISLLETNISQDSVNTCERTYKKVAIRNMTLTCKPPNNLVFLKSGTILEILKIVEDTNQPSCPTQNRLYFEGYRRKVEGEMFGYPCSSSIVGAIKLGRRSNDIKKYPAFDILQKVVKLKVKHRVEYASTMLHA